MHEHIRSFIFLFVLGYCYFFKPAFLAVLADAAVLRRERPWRSLFFCSVDQNHLDGKLHYFFEILP